MRARWLLVPAGGMVLGVGLLAWLGGFDGLYGQDPYAYYEYAMGPLRAAVLRLEPLPPFHWPPGYPLLATLLSLGLGSTPLAGQLVSLLMGGTAVVFTGLLAREVWPAEEAGGRRAWPLAAALLVACQGQLWQSSAVHMADTTGLALAALAIWALARYGRTGALGWLLLATAALVWAMLTRWIYGLVAVPAAAYVLLGSRERAGLTTGRWWRHGSAAAVLGSCLLVPFLLPAARGLLAAPEAPAPFAGQWQVYTWHPLNALRREFITADGYLNYRLPNGLYYAMAPAHRFYFTPLLAWLILPGLWTIWRRARQNAALWLLVVAWAAVVYGFHAGAPWQNFRFTLAYLPPLAVIAALGLQAVWRWLGQRRAWLIGLGFGVGLLLMVIGGVQLTQQFIERKQADLAMVRAVEAQLPDDARLLTFGPTLTFQHYSQLETMELYLLKPADLPGLLAEGRPVFVLVDVQGLETQWRDHAVAADVEWLRDGPGLEAIEQFGIYTLYRIGSEA